MALLVALRSVPTREQNRHLGSSKSNIDHVNLRSYVHAPVLSFGQLGSLLLNIVFQLICGVIWVNLALGNVIVAIALGN